MCNDTDIHLGASNNFLKSLVYTLLMADPTDEIKEIINRETKAWNNKDTELLLSVFHQDMVWVWPKDNKSHNPIDWQLPLGKFDYNRWMKIYNDMFEKNQLIKNDRKIIDIKISEDGNGAFAVVDVDTLWEDKGGNQLHWLGRAGKTYVKVKNRWTMISHVGLLIYK